MKSLDKIYQPEQIEKRLYHLWETKGAFEAGQKPEAEAYTIVIPPPNVTGSLHMGHALNNTLQDILCRFERLRGRDVLWQVGTDHAGIATQMVVERQLEAENISRRDIGRDAFLKRVWQWKKESGTTITKQLRRLGASCDWSTERFTMDEGLSEAVIKVFVELYEKGLIYRDKRLVNWDPVLLTAVSDLEVISKEEQGYLWHFKYPLAEDETKTVTVATTRPETLLGDTAIAVNPNDERYQNLIGQYVKLPLVGRLIPIVADEYADPEQGSGAVKITPAHDFNDFEVGKRHDLMAINVLDERGQIDLQDSEHFESMDCEEWQGLDRFKARQNVIEKMKALGLLAEVQEHIHAVPYGDRSGVIIEPRLTDQWYVNAHTLAQPAIEAVKKGDMKFVPSNWDKTYFEWMNNIQPWCISRQLWWGHQIPAWYDEDGQVYVAYTQEEAEKKAGGKRLTRDEDVLDTWFSSALWPFSTLGWPQETEKLKRHYKTDVLVTGFDIIFFWVARMMMMGLEFQKEVPFHTVYIHALVRDENGAKMSKSKGNVVDPLELIEAYGADALRFTLSSMAAQGRDVKLANSRVEGYRNFGTKLWNAARFAQMNNCFQEEDLQLSDIDNFTPLNRWIISEVIRAEKSIRQALEAYRFNDASHAVYHFIWTRFCDWYVELAKPLLQSDKIEEAEQTRETKQVTKWVLKQSLILLHPFMPFVTEELWQELFSNQTFLMQNDWVQLNENLINQEADESINWLIKLITDIRSVRSEMNVPASAKINIGVFGANTQTQKRIEIYDTILKRLARLEQIHIVDTLPEKAIQIVVEEAHFFLQLEGVIDFEAECQRLEKALAKIDQDIIKITAKLENKSFLEKAPEAVIEENKNRLKEQKELRDKTQESLDKIK